MRFSPLRIILTVLTIAAPAVADEGMWLPNALPVEQLKQKYNFTPTDAWMDHLRESCVRFGRGGSASFVSADGLIMTNHHVGSGAIQRVSTAEHDYMANGFYAPTRDKEISCPDLEIFNLREIRDVTAQVNKNISPGMSLADANATRKAAIAKIEKDAEDETGLYPEMVTLYHGERYHLYLYKKYTDVRLVMCPHSDAAFFGGDIRNFGYPRHCLDVSFFRAYEDGKPAKVEHYLKWAKDGVEDGDLVFTSGHPARTRRLYTVAHLDFLRDVELPLILTGYNQREVALLQYCAQSEEHQRRGQNDLLGIQNGRKAYGGMVNGLLDASLMNKKIEAEKQLRDYVNSNPELKAKYGSAWDELAQALDEAKSYYVPYFLLENRRMGLCRTYGMAARLVRYATEIQKPDEDRLDGYHDTQLDSLKRSLTSPAPIYEDLEHLYLADGITRLARILGAEDEVVLIARGSVSPEQRATELLAGTKLFDVAYRQKLLDDGPQAILASNDSLIQLAKKIDPYARKLRTLHEDTLESAETDAYAKIAKAVFAKYGESIYPDATFSLRISFGTVKGYEERGEQIPPFTTMGEVFVQSRKFKNQQPYHLPQQWLDRESNVDAKVPYNFVTTNDIIGGNSGSPAVNREGEIIGIVFDGNIQSLSWDFQFAQVQGRAVFVDARAIIEALRSVYDATAMANEMLTGHAS